MKTKITLLLLTAIPMISVAQRVSVNDFADTVGTWNGKLVYLDYQTHQPYEMPADLEVTAIGPNAFKQIHLYPNEPSANSTDTLSIAPDGKKIDNELVKSKRKLTDGNLEIVTEIEGKDGNDNRPALMRHIYLIGKTKLEIKKEVQFHGAKDWILRHTYSYRRK